MNNVNVSKISKENIFFTSDTHFSHERIIEYCNRPFESITQMNNTLIKNWNKVISEDSHIFILGDFCWKGYQTWQNILKKLNGHKHLILGNHDLKCLKNNFDREEFDSISHGEVLNIENDIIVLNHYPLLSFPGIYHKNWYNLFGHVHTRPNNTGLDAELIENNITKSQQYDVGVDNNNYTPISWIEIKDKLTSINK